MPPPSHLQHPSLARDCHPADPASALSSSKDRVVTGPGAASPLSREQTPESRCVPVTPSGRGGNRRDSFVKVNQSLRNPGSTLPTNNGVTGRQRPDSGRGPCQGQWESSNYLNTSPPGRFYLCALGKGGWLMVSSGYTRGAYLLHNFKERNEKRQKEL